MTVSLYDFFLLITPLRSILRYVHRTVFSTFAIIKTSSEQFATQAFAKMLSYFDILTVSSTLNLGIINFFTRVNICARFYYIITFLITSTGFILFVL